MQKTNPPVPVRYEMNGYDTLLTSYYDKYIIDYTLYEKWDYNKDVMLIPQCELCFVVGLMLIGGIMISQKEEP